MRCSPAPASACAACPCGWPDARSDPAGRPAAAGLLVSDMRFLLGLLLAAACALGHAQDVEREDRLAKETLAGLVVGDPVWLEQKGGHRFLGLYQRAARERGA